MTTRLTIAAEKRLAERRAVVRRPVATTQRALWEALTRGDVDEALRQARIVEQIRGPQRDIGHLG